MSKKIIVILGPGRSGTSLLMHILYHLGMGVSDNLIAESVANPLGPFEDAEIFETQTALLQELGTNVFVPMPDGWLQDKASFRTIANLEKIIQNRIEKCEGIFGFKDPRTSMLIPLWVRVFNKLKISPAYILAIREPKAVISSFLRQYNQPPEMVELVVLVRLVEALYHTAADCFIVHYEDWFKDKASEVALKLLKYTGLEHYFNGNINEVLQKVVAPNLNRAVYDEYEIKNLYILKLYEVLKHCRDTDFNRDKLMAVVKECRQAMEGFKGWYINFHKYIKEVNTLKNQIEEFKKKHQESETIVKSLSKQNEELKKKLEDLESPSKIRINEIEDIINLAMNAMKALAEYKIATASRLKNRVYYHDSKKKLSIILVLGAPKSGVGLMGRCLDLLEIENLNSIKIKSPHDENTTYSYTLIDEIYGLMNSKSSEFDSVRDRSLTPEIIEKTQEVISKFIEGIINTRTRSEQHNHVVYLADIRVLRIFKLWEESISKLGLDIRVLHIFRHPWEVVASMESTEGIEKQKAGNIWLNSIIQVLEICSRYPHCMISFDQLITDPIYNTLSFVMNSLKLPLQISNYKFELLSFIQPTRKHFYSSNIDMHNKKIFAVHSKIYQELKDILNLSMSFTLK